MRYRLLVLVGLVLGLSGVEASEPGQPLDCSDWVFHEPGLTCQEIIDCGGAAGDVGCLFTVAHGVYDNQGRLIQRIATSPLTTQGTGSWALMQVDTAQPVVIATIDSRESDKIRIDGFAFDAVNGALAVTLHVLCDSPTGCEYAPNRWVALISGFTPLFDALQTYQPALAGTSFRVPRHPEGLRAADHFDTYAGILSSSDFRQMQPLRCNYPSTIPAVGDLLQVADTLPEPPLGDGFFFVTATTYQGRVRYGRQSNDGQLSGRDPSLLPECVGEQEVTDISMRREEAR